jgi:phosphoribosyl-ATP pyrophosphohydrolase
MAEIKSTLDLVLERTKNLTMTEEEKASLQRKELEGKIRGWGQKYLDGLMDLSAVRTEMASIPENHRKAGRNILKGFVLEHIDTQGDIGKIFDLLEGILEESRESYLAAIQNFQKALAAERSRFLEALRAGLAGRGISGSAVTPSLARDEAWKLFHEKALAEFRKGIALIRRDN